MAQSCVPREKFRGELLFIAILASLICPKWAVTRHAKPIHTGLNRLDNFVSQYRIPIKVSRPFEDQRHKNTSDLSGQKFCHGEGGDGRGYLRAG